MGLFDFLSDVVDVLDELTDNDTHYRVSCDTLEIFEIGTTWKGTARVHGAGEHVRTEKVDYSTIVTMPEEDTHDYTRRGLLRKDLREWCGRTFANKSTVTKETIVLNDGEDCLSCQGFIKKVENKWILTTNSHEAEYYGAYKLYLTKDGKDVGHEDLDYLFMADTLGYVSSVNVKEGFF